MRQFRQELKKIWFWRPCSCPLCVLIYALACHHWASQAMLPTKQWEWCAHLPSPPRGCERWRPMPALYGRPWPTSRCVTPCMLPRATQNQIGISCKPLSQMPFLLQDDQEIDGSTCQHWVAHGLHITLWLVTGTITAAARDPDIFLRRADGPGDGSTGNGQNHWYDVHPVVKQRVPPAQSGIWSESPSCILAFLCFAAAGVALLVKLASPSPERAMVTVNFFCDIMWFVPEPAAQRRTMHERLVRQHPKRQHLSLQSCFCFRSASGTAILSAFPCHIASQPGDEDVEIQIIRELFVRQFH